MASHRLPDEERPRRAVPAWVTAPPEDGSGASVPTHVSDPGLEARPTPVGSAPAPETVGPVASFPAPQSAPVLSAEDVVVPDYPPQEDLLPPAPTSPAVHTVPFERAVPAPVSPIDAAPPAAAPLAGAPLAAAPPAAAPPVPVTPAVPVVGQPRFSVPGLEHVVVEGSEPEPSGPIGYRTPARFAHQRPVTSMPAPTSVPARSFDAVIAAPAPSATHAPVVPPATVLPATVPIATVRATATETAPPAVADGSAGADPGLQAGAERADAPGATDAPVRKPAVGATPGAVLGAVAGLATLGLAAWWFTAPATVHGVGVALGAIALLLTIVTLRNPSTTWQRPIALLGAVLGGVGTLGLLWAVASAVLPMVGVTLPDLTGTGTTPTLAP